MNETIELTGMRFYAFHGHYDVEQQVGNQFIVDVTLEHKPTKAIFSDCLEDAVDYQKIYQVVKKEMGQISSLLENVAYRILQALKNNFTDIQKITIKVSKLNPAMGGEIEKATVILSEG